MIVLVSILAVVLLFSVLLFVMMTHAFKNPVRPHKQIPASFPEGFREITIPAKNDKNLYGWWFPVGEDAPTLILVHGWGRSVERMTPYIEKLCCNGYNLLAFDSRNHGNSDPDHYSTMVKFAEDIGSSIDYAHQTLQVRNKQVSVIGLSIGGSASIYASAIDKRISRVVTVGAFAHPADVMTKQLQDRYIPKYPFIWALLKYIEQLVGLSFDDIAPENNICKSEASFLLIHGKKDQVVPLAQAKRLMEKAHPGKARLWSIEGKGHSDCHFDKDFWKRIAEFLA